jgi:GMP synthase-like glutamine amidotransferase
MPTTIVFQHFTFPCLGHLGQFLDASGVAYECKIYSDLSDEMNDALIEADQLILLGSPASVNGNELWIPVLRKVVQRHLANNKPMFGICFGAQMIASALGSAVVRLEAERLGFRQLGSTTEGAISGNWLCLHEEHVLPSDKIETLMVDSETLYAFRYGNVIGLQFHPEIDATSLDEIADSIGKDHQMYGKLQESIQNFDNSSRERSYKLFEYIFSEIHKLTK